MDTYLATEIAYKNGHKSGYIEGIKKAISIVKDTFTFDEIVTNDSLLAITHKLSIELGGE